MTKRQIVIAIIIVLAIGSYFALRPNTRDGKGIFKSEGCVKCHTFKNFGKGIIDLSDITERKTDTWIRDQIIDARQHDPNSAMPRFGYLPQGEIDELIRFLHSDPAAN